MVAGSGREVPSIPTLVPLMSKSELFMCSASNWLSLVGSTCRETPVDCAIVWTVATVLSTLCGRQKMVISFAPSIATWAIMAAKDHLHSRLLSSRLFLTWNALRVSKL